MKAFDRLVEGGPLPGCAPFRVVVDHGYDSAAIVVKRGEEPIIACALAWSATGAEDAWSWIGGIYGMIADRLPRPPGPAKEARRPAVLPWLAVMNLSREDAGLFRDFVRCLAWRILGWRILED